MRLMNSGEVMAKKKATDGPVPGTKIRVREGVPSPEFPDVLLSGWTGTIVEASGKPPTLKIILEWDAETMSRMPADYVSRCEAQQLFYSMACLTSDDIDILS